MKKLFIFTAVGLLSLTSFASNGRMETKPAVEKQILVFSPNNSQTKEIVQNTEESKTKELPSNCNFSISVTTPSGYTYTMHYSVWMPTASSCATYAQFTMDSFMREF